MGMHVRPVCQLAAGLLAGGLIGSRRIIKVTPDIVPFVLAIYALSLFLFAHHVTHRSIDPTRSPVYSTVCIPFVVPTTSTEENYSNEQWTQFAHHLIASPV